MHRAPTPRSLRCAPLVITRISHSLRHHQPNPSSRAASTKSTPTRTPPAQQAPPSAWSARKVLVATGALAVAAGAAYPPIREQAQATLQDAQHAIRARINMFAQPSREKLLPDVPKGMHSVRTLVIDLEKTLVSSSYTRASGWRIAKRPGAEAFLAYMASFYEIVVFTSSLNMYADPILDKLDPNMYISHRLYRAETHYRNGVHVKDLSRLNRDLSRVIVIDHDEKHVSMQPENCILIPKWDGDASDTSLLDLIPVLEGVVRRDVKDVRNHIGVLRGKPLAEGVAEYRALADAQMQAEGGRAISLFGRAVDGADDTRAVGRPGANGEDDDGAAPGAVWGRLSGSGFFSRPAPAADKR
ncbi:Mitochondrial import inner membrane translocase subunit tim50 [Gracilariopsis chorda]|uniref:Mitochondrial import inner membrane translocase subunit TIM50 n=1 Tax=Gracilariopsis chorda TaxID=448386 RepID=A0A2V3IGJ8_9FLOR|nr:Mitochondrial import inner membrane translocase subunit tim50 [Gracilariopsis chorda]|eukprot:PXF41214.1 Mitochondrial import inner membrane translocase subunit tim50 [Gracilariopsis chorda]